MSTTKSTSAWITHVKKFAADNNLKYNEALRNPKLREGYVAKPKKERKFTMGKDKEVECVEHSGKNNKKELTVKSVKVAAKRQTLGKGRDLTQPPVVLDETGTIVPDMVPVKKGRPKKNKEVVLM